MAGTEQLWEGRCQYTAYIFEAEVSPVPSGAPILVTAGSCYLTRSVAVNRMSACLPASSSRHNPKMIRGGRLHTELPSTQLRHAMSVSVFVMQEGPERKLHWQQTHRCGGCGGGGVRCRRFVRLSRRSGHPGSCRSLGEPCLKLDR